MDEINKTETGTIPVWKTNELRKASYMLYNWGEVKIIYEQRVREMREMRMRAAFRGKPHKQQKRRFRLFRR